MTTRPDVPDRAVEAARKALAQILNVAWHPQLPWKGVATGGNPPTRQHEAEVAVEAAAPHIIEQFIDGLTDAQIKDLLFVAGLRAAAKKDSGYGPEIRAGLKRLIPTPEGKK